MNDFRTTEIKLIGAFFLVTGLFGFYTFLTLIFPLDNLISIINIFPTVLFGLTLYSGYLLLLKENVKGIEIARAVMALQILHFHIGGIGYLFVTGAFVFAGVNNLKFGFTFGFQNTFIINLSEETGGILFKVNVLAIAIFIYLTKVMKKIYEEQERIESLENQKLNAEEDLKIEK